MPPSRNISATLGKAAIFSTIVAAIVRAMGSVVVDRLRRDEFEGFPTALPPVRPTITGAGGGGRAGGGAGGGGRAGGGAGGGGCASGGARGDDEEGGGASGGGAGRCD